MAPGLALASTPVTIQRVIPYADGVGNADLRAKCDWNRRLSADIVTESRDHVVATDQDPAAAAGPYLQMTIVSAHTTGGGLFGGPKWARIQGELFDHGKLLGSFVAQRSTTRSWTACGAVDRIGKEMAGDIVEWLRAPTMNAQL